MRFLTAAVLGIAVLIVGCGDYDEARIASSLMSTGGTLTDTGYIEVANSDGRWWNESPVRVQVYYLEFAPHVAKNVDIEGSTDHVIHSIVKNSQKFFADEMERHNHGRQTFSAFTKPDGSVNVRRIKLKHPIEKYEENGFSLLDSELGSLQYAKLYQFRRTINVFFTTLQLPGIYGAGVWGTTRGDVYIFRRGWDPITLSHELGHSMELPHDFRSNSYIMSYGSDRRELSEEAAQWLSRHRAFNEESFENIWAVNLNDINAKLVDLDSLTFKVDFKNLQWKSDRQREQIITYDYAVLVSGIFESVISYTDNLEYASVFEPLPGGYRDKIRRNAVYTIDFQDVEIAHTNVVKIRMIGKLGQITYVPNDISLE